jgi:hypothetical protein
MDTSFLSDCFRSYAHTMAPSKPSSLVAASIIYRATRNCLWRKGKHYFLLVFNSRPDWLSRDGKKSCMYVFTDIYWYTYTLGSVHTKSSTSWTKGPAVIRPRTHPVVFRNGRFLLFHFHSLGNPILQEVTSTSPKSVCARINALARLDGNIFAAIYVFLWLLFPFFCCIPLLLLNSGRDWLTA